MFSSKVTINVNTPYLRLKRSFSLTDMILQNTIKTAEKLKIEPKEDDDHA
jgi:hypothetical protein